MAESAYDRLSRNLDHQIQDPIPLIFYKTHSEFEQNNIIQGFIPENIGAFATDVRFRMILPVDLPDNELYELVLHELTHILSIPHALRWKISSQFPFPSPSMAHGGNGQLLRRR